MIGNRDQLPWHPAYVEALGVLPFKARIYWVEDEDPWVEDDGTEVPWPWQLDGYAVVDGQFAVTEHCWNFPTWASAVEALPEFEQSVRDVVADQARR